MSRKKKKVEIQEVMEVHHVYDGDDTVGWIHTHGLEKYGKPELEIRNIPLFLGPAATYLLNQIADYVVNQNMDIKPGEKMSIGTGRPIFIQFEKLPPIQSSLNHFREERLALIDPPEAYQCAECAGCAIDKSVH